MDPSDRFETPRGILGSSPEDWSDLIRERSSLLWEQLPVVPTGPPPAPTATCGGIATEFESGVLSMEQHLGRPGHYSTQLGEHSPPTVSSEQCRVTSLYTGAYIRALQCVDSGSVKEMPADLQKEAINILNQLNADFAAARQSELTTVASSRRCCCQ